ncbi:universal stress protein [Nitrosarchaeum sp.]|nr:universal stress protein [Nitrosarchaeum sp.]
MRKSIYMSILVPLDGSKYSEKALLHACNMAKTYCSRLILLYVVEKSITVNLLDRGEYLKILRRFGNNVLIKGKKTSTQNGVDSKIIMKEGSIVNEIVKLAKKERCNLIIVGSRGLGATAKFFLGSISNKLASNSPCSILIVK